jgi:hypothetical protein
VTPWRTLTFAATALSPRKSCTDDEESVASSTGSLNTTMILPFNATSVFPRGGTVRTTAGRRRRGTFSRSSAAVIPLANRISISTVSPATAGTGTGSSPPPTIGALTMLPVRTLAMTAVSPLGYVLGRSET